MINRLLQSFLASTILKKAAVVPLPGLLLLRTPIQTLPLRGDLRISGLS
jgi:hypothetical protein